VGKAENKIKLNAR